MIRYQLSMFVQEAEALEIEAWRRQLDAVQFALISAHVTLVREDELQNLDRLWLHVKTNKLEPLNLVFGAAQRSFEHGVLLPCIDGQSAFHQLRQSILGDGARDMHAHMTLAHPRNPRSSANTDDILQRIPSPLSFRFARISLIQQIDHAAWQILDQVPSQK
ncbi:MAG: 2'-5' RNA ligase family protein [Burkholderiaceae bacterium]|nr:MAG: 2'-5' RNA ligase family protein [Burkholderiaceae bacterium]